MKIFIFSQQMLGPSFEIFVDKDSFYLQYQLSARYQFICIHEWNSRLSHMVWDFLIWTSDSRPRLARDPWQCIASRLQLCSVRKNNMVTSLATFFFTTSSLMNINLSRNCCRLFLQCCAGATKTYLKSRHC